MKKILLPLSFFAATFSFAQQQQHKTCGTLPLPQDEDWIDQMITSSRQSGGQEVQNAYTIPVIVHVINNGEAIGTGYNISQAQINSEIVSLNKDYSLSNSDFSSVCPAAFQGVAANPQITFCLALRDPFGNTLAEPGIDRINRNTMGFTAPPYTMGYCDGTIKPPTIWNVYKYLNIWVCRLGQNLLGYATFPVNSTNVGLQAPYGGATNDGVVIEFDVFGTVGNVSPPYNKGRTVTHEVGHWLGLRHIWGDDSNVDGICNGTDACTGSDYCNDTPNACDCHFGAPTFPSLDMCSPTSPGTMYCNYMDYSDDGSMVMFTANQKTRMQTTMQHATYRVTLQNSWVCSPLGIDNVSASDKFKMYPNPSNGKINVDADYFGSDVHVKIYNVVGEVVKEMQIGNNLHFDIDLSDKQNGLYFIELNNGSEKATQKLVLQK